MRKSEITIRHYDGAARPVVSVKVAGGGADLDRAIDTLIETGAEFAVPGFSAAWIRATLTDDEQAAYYDNALADGWQEIDQAARAIWGPDAQAYSAGRSSGWVYVAGGLYRGDDIASWDAIMLSSWRRFERALAVAVQDQAYRYAWAVWATEFEPRTKAARDREVLTAAAVASLCDRGPGA